MGRTIVSLAIVLSVFSIRGGMAQDKNSLTQQSKASGKAGVGILEQLGVGGARSGEQFQLSGTYTIDKGTRHGQLAVKATLAPTWHVYSTTQKAGGPMMSQISVESSKEFRLTRPFVPEHAPHSVQEVFPVTSEVFEDEVTWTAPFEAAEGVDLAKLSFQVKFSGQICSEKQGCIPISKQPVEVKFAGEQEPVGVPEYVVRGVHAKVRGQLSPRTVKPGETAKVSLTVEPTEAHHVYAYADRDPEGVSKPTLIAWKNRQGWAGGAVTASEKPIEHQTKLPEEPVQWYYDRPAMWSVELKVPADATPGGYELRGVIGYQVCSNQSCDLPTGAEFRVIVEVVKAAQPADAGAEPLLFAKSTYASAAKLALGEVSSATPRNTTAAPATGDAERRPAGAARFEFEKLRPREVVDSARPFHAVLPIALLAGFLLNFMPCVLPVIGLKIVSFAN